MNAAKFNESGLGRRCSADAARVLAHPDEALIGTDLSNHPTYRAAATQSSGELTAPNPNGEERRFFFRRMASPESVDPRPWLILTAIDEAEASSRSSSCATSWAPGSPCSSLIGILIAWGVSRSLNRPMDALGGMARAVEGRRPDPDEQRPRPGRHRAPGDSARPDGEGAAGARSRQGRLRPLHREAGGRTAAAGQLDLGGEAKRVTIVFSDIRDFTTMAETMTPEQVVTFLNDYFSEMVDAVMEQGGMLDKFLGDGMMAVFGSFGDQPDHARRAVLREPADESAARQDQRRARRSPASRRSPSASASTPRKSSSATSARSSGSSSRTSATASTRRRACRPSTRTSTRPS